MMSFFTNRGINRLGTHLALVSLAWSLAGIFFMVFLLRAGLAPVHIFLVAASIFSFRLMLRPLLVLVASAIGLRRTLILGTLLYALQFPALAIVHEIGPALILFVFISSLGQVFYWTCYHALFTSLGDIEHRGKQIGARQMLSAVAGIIGPVAGGLLLRNFGAWVAFGVAFMIQIAATYPLLRLDEPKITQPSPRGAFKAATVGVLLFFADGWIQVGSTTAWTFVMFQALAERFDWFGELTAVAGLGGALGGMVLGRFIDMGHARRSVWFNAVILAACLIFKATAANNAFAVISIAIGTTLFAGLYYPYWMTAVYNASKNSPCAFRFQFASEVGWDAGGILACLVAALVCAVGLPITAVVALALPMVAIQALLVDASYLRNNRVSKVPLAASLADRLRTVLQ